MGFFLVIMLLQMLLFGGYAFGYALFFGVTYAPKRRLCSCICYFSVLMPYALILGSNMLSRGDCATAVLLCGRFLYLRVGAPAWIETRHYVLPWCRGALWYVLLCCWLLTARCSSRPLFSVGCVLGCVRAVFLCLLFLQIEDVDVFLKKNQNAPRFFEHPPVRGGKMSKRLGGIKDCKYKTSSWHLNGFPYGGNIGSTV